MQNKQIVIYTRFSDAKQRQESLRAQELKCRQHLERLGIDPGPALVLREGGQRGDLESRVEYERLVGMIRGGEISILLVDQQSRFSRGFNVGGLVQDVVFSGGRFIAVGDGIDTERHGWQDLVGLKEIHNRMEIRDTGWRVRRSQEQLAATEDRSAGDMPYGYGSEYVDPAAALAYHGRGPKPPKRIVIHEAAAQVVREIHSRFVGGQSIAAIVRWLNQVKEQVPKIGKGDWHHQHVRRILTNPKYIGEWSFGRTTTMRDSQGRKKQVPARKDQQVTRQIRPQLRIVDQALWDAGRSRIQKLLEIYGMRKDGKKRGPAEYYRLLYPKTLLAGLVHCGCCGSRLVVQHGGVKRLGCPKHRAGKCPMVARMPYAKAEAAILAFFQDLLESYPAFIQKTVAEMRLAIQEMAQAVPQELTSARTQLGEVTKEIENLVDALAKGLNSSAVSGRLARLEAEKATLEKTLGDLQQTRTAEMRMPEEDWVKQQLQDLASLLKQEKPVVSMLRSMLSKVVAEEVKSPGKKRGYTRLRFRIDGWAALARVLSPKLPPRVVEMLRPADPAAGLSEEFVIELGMPTRMDQWAPRIATWRREKVPWKQIAERTGLSLGNAYTAYKRWVGSEKNQAA